MEADDLLEEGEISNDSDTDYTPLERPTNYSEMQPLQRFAPRIQDSESDEEIVQSSDSDSDSDNLQNKIKRPKIKLKPLPKQTTSNRNKKYDIWSTRLQEEMLLRNLDSCDVTTKDKSRDVESYDYTIARKYYEELEAAQEAQEEDQKQFSRQTTKRTRDDRKNSDFRPRRRYCDVKQEQDEENDKHKGKPRSILNLTVTIDDGAEEIAKDIANKLCEEKEQLILKVIETMGKKRAIEIFEETRKIENEGGMMIMNQTRRRTPGGVFLYLVRNDYHITLAQKQHMFGDERKEHKKMLKEKQKQKLNKLKVEMNEERAKLLPDLLTRAELLVAESNRNRKETSDGNVMNPPPTPEADCHENSGDGMDGFAENIVNSENTSYCNSNRGKLESYEEDFLDINCSNDMDMF